MIKKIILALFAVTLFAACEKEVTSTVFLEKSAVNRMIYIDSNPAGSMIYVNGKISGKNTPDTLFWLEDTTYLITLKRELFRDTSLITRPLEEVAQKTVDYYANPKMYGYINCDTKPDGADIFINDSITGKKTPAKIGAFFPGKYKVTYKFKEYRDASFYVNVKSDAAVGYEIALEDTSIWATFVTDNSELPDNNIKCVVADHNNIIWAGTEAGLVRFDGSNWKTFTPGNSGLPTSDIISLAVDHNNGLWIGTTYGAVLYDGSTWTVHNTSNSLLPNDIINIIEIDAHNRKWFGTYHGIGLLSEEGWTLYNTDNCNLAGNIITSICTNVMGETWVSSVKTGITRYYGEWKPLGKIKFPFQGGSGSPGQNVSSIESAPDGVAWLGFIPIDPDEYGGLISWDKRRYRLTSGMPSNYITCLYIDHDNVKWVGTDAGIVRFIDSANKKIFMKNYTGMKSNFVTDIEKDLRGVVWIATDYGLVKYKGEAYNN